MVILAMTERDLPLLKFFALLSTKLQAAVTGSADVIPKDIAYKNSEKKYHAFRRSLC